MLGGRGSNTVNLSIAGTQSLAYILMTACKCFLSQTVILLTILLTCSFADLQNPQMNFDGKACAAVGQSVLMAIYDTLFSQVSHAPLICILVVKRVWRYLFLTRCLYDYSLM